MGTGIGRGENRALEAAQQAISSPLLDNVSITGASAVLLNIVGGDDLTLGEATTISEIVHEAVGEDAEIIFGAGNDPAMQGEIRVTVIATGFDRGQMHEKSPSGVISFPGRRQRPAATEERHARNDERLAPPSPPPGQVRPMRQPHPQSPPGADVPDMEIPTFIRRQMD
jgi:cell division protein FtsZ